MTLRDVPKYHRPDKSKGNAEYGGRLSYFAALLSPTIDVMLLMIVTAQAQSHDNAWDGVFASDTGSLVRCLLEHASSIGKKKMRSATGRYFHVLVHVQKSLSRQSSSPTSPILVHAMQSAHRMLLQISS
jgi:hypothetical protein